MYTIAGADRSPLLYSRPERKERALSDQGNIKAARSVPEKMGPESMKDKASKQTSPP